MTNLWNMLNEFGNGTVDISVFETYGLDNHPFFENFWYTTFEKCTTFLKIQKNDTITYCEFLNTIQNTTYNTDILCFVLALMEGVVRHNKLASYTSTTPLTLENMEKLYKWSLDCFSQTCLDQCHAEKLNFVAEQMQIILVSLDGNYNVTKVLLNKTFRSFI